jgi:exoribonuclease R
MENTEKIKAIYQFIAKQLKQNELPATKIFDLAQKQSFDNNDILLAIKQLTDDKTVISHNRMFYLTANLNVKHGFIHSNITGMLWIEDKDKTNSFGVCFDVPEEITPIGNKKDAELGSECSYVELSDNEDKFLYIINTKQHKPIKILAAKKHRTWVNINNNYYSKLKLNKDFQMESLSDMTDGDIVELLSENGNHKLLNKIGNIADKGSESKIVKILTEVESPNDEVSVSKNKNNLKTLSNEFITIDGNTTKDIDDAISIEKTIGGYKLLVAIANVDAAIPKDSKEDLFAKKNATTFYLEFEKVSMFHEKISEDICSLNIGENKNAFVCEMNFDNQGVQKSYSFYEANIKVSYKTPYEDVDSIFSGTETQSSLYFDGENVRPMGSNIPKNLNEQLKNLKELTDFLKKEELERDYWFLKMPEHVLGDDGKIKYLELKEENRSISQSIVENCMLSANIAAANILREKAPNIGIFRNQATKVEFEKPMPASYETINEGHWGLQEETYTHFTSPIRRYCDLVVHRIIKSIIYNQPSPYTEEEVQDIVKNINKQQYKHKQMNSKERVLLNQEYLQALVSKKELKSKFELASFNSKGCVFTNKQHIEIFMPLFKVQKEIADYLSEHIKDKDVQKHIDYINNYWQMKAFIDSYNWIDNKKDVTMKFYLKEHKIEQEKQANQNNSNKIGL